MAVVARKITVSEEKKSNTTKKKGKQEQVRPWSYDSSIYREKSFRWYEDPKETTRSPYITSPRDYQSIYGKNHGYKTYLQDIKGLNDKRKPELADNSKTKQTLWLPPGYLISDREADTYAKISSLYDSSKAKQKREKDFIKKYVDFRMQCHKDHMLKKREEEWCRMEEKRKILEKLKSSRLEFEFKKLMRFRTQYVTTRMLEHEKPERNTFGLPPEVDWESKFPKLKRKKGKPSMFVDERKFENIAKEKHTNDLFGWNYPDMDPRITPPKMFNRRNNSFETLSKNDHSSSRDSITEGKNVHQSKNTELKKKQKSSQKGKKTEGKVKKGSAK